ncbi:unnamed protein product [Bodo saltans]|uniref:Uncharacterized protein n=1 Tax=Bodo saltans TaxID=75058 RepID=A0A0S4J786_BODSA|nr:unnamed protein product [Bodo saltans]|eukprot:CUG85680.1 unnamed protein product [Bodo saltans]
MRFAQAQMNVLQSLHLCFCSLPTTCDKQTASMACFVGAPSTRLKDMPLHVKPHVIGNLNLPEFFKLELAPQRETDLQHALRWVQPSECYNGITKRLHLIKRPHKLCMEERHLQTLYDVRKFVALDTLRPGSTRSLSHQRFGNFSVSEDGRPWQCSRWVIALPAKWRRRARRPLRTSPHSKWHYATLMFAKPFCDTPKWHYATLMFGKPFCETPKWHYATLMCGKPFCDTPKWHYATVMFAKPFCETPKWHYATLMCGKPFCETPKWHYATVMFAKPFCDTPKWHYR